MLRKLLLLTTIALPILANGQSYNQQILNFRERYKEGLLTGSHPLKSSEIGYTRFYEPDFEYRVKAVFVPITGEKPFFLKNVHGGTQKAVRVFGYVYFNLEGASLKLYVYRFVDMANNTDLNDRLFIPFTDRTNYKETFGGGRYLDMSMDDIKNNEVFLDFNKCYNPHTAYEKGYPYIMPPQTNNLHIEIRAGEQIFGHNPGY